MNIKSLFAGLLILIFTTGYAFAKVETKQEADAFLVKYCIELVSSIEDQYEDQKKLVAEEKWKEFFEKGSIIVSIADVYSKLCK